MLAITSAILISFWLRPGASERLALILLVILINALYLNRLYSQLGTHGDLVPLVCKFVINSLQVLAWTLHEQIISSERIHIKCLSCSAVLPRFPGDGLSLPNLDHSASLFGCDKANFTSSSSRIHWKFSRKCTSQDSVLRPSTCAGFQSRFQRRNRWWRQIGVNGKSESSGLGLVGSSSGSNCFCHLFSGLYLFLCGPTLNLNPKQVWAFLRSYQYQGGWNCVCCGCSNPRQAQV